MTTGCRREDAAGGCRVEGEIENQITGRYEPPFARLPAFPAVLGNGHAVCFGMGHQDVGVPGMDGDTGDGIGVRGDFPPTLASVARDLEA